MRYINKKTKAFINSDCVIKGGDWEPVNEKTKKTQKAEKNQTTGEEKDEE